VTRVAQPTLRVLELGYVCRRMRRACGKQLRASTVQRTLPLPAKVPFTAPPKAGPPNDAMRDHQSKSKKGTDRRRRVSAAN
jgi:hypothetical protein